MMTPESEASRLREKMIPFWKMAENCLLVKRFWIEVHGASTQDLVEKIEQALQEAYQRGREEGIRSIKQQMFDAANILSNPQPKTDEGTK